MAVPALIYVAFNWGDPDDAARLGDPGGDRHRLRARRAVAARHPRAGVAEGVPHRARDHRRPRRGASIIALFYTERPLAARSRRRRRPCWRRWSCSTGVRRDDARALPRCSASCSGSSCCARASTPPSPACSLALTIPLRHARQARGHDAALAAAPARACAAHAGRLPHRADLRLRQCRRLLRRRHARRRSASPLTARRRRSACSSASWSASSARFLAAIRLGFADLPAGAELAAAGRRRAALRHRLHHEPVHRPPRLRRHPPAQDEVKIGILAGSLLAGRSAISCCASAIARSGSLGSRTGDARVPAGLDWGV